MAIWCPCPCSLISRKSRPAGVHVIEINLAARSSGRKARTFHFILAADELPLLWRHLLWTGRRNEGRICILQRMELWIIVADEVWNAPTDDMSAKCLNAATRNASATRGTGLARVSRIAVEKRARAREETFRNGNARGSGTTGDKFKLSGSPAPRLRRLLEPLRAMHSIGSSHIDAPISELYRETILTSLSRIRTSSQDLFPTLVSTYEEAMTTFKAGCSTLAVQQLRSALDMWNDLTYLYTAKFSHGAGDSTVRRVFLLREALGTIRHDLFKTLTRAYLADCEEVQRNGAAETLAYRIVASYDRSDQWGQRIAREGHALVPASRCVGAARPARSRTTVASAPASFTTFSRR